MKRNLSISRAWDETKPILSRDGGLLATVAAALIVLPTVLVSAIVPGEPKGAGESALQFIGALISIVGQMALIRLAIQPPTTVGAAIGHAVKRFPAMLGALVLLIIAIILLLLPLAAIAVAAGINPPSAGQQPTGSSAVLVLVMVLVVIAFSIRFIMATPVATAESVGPIAIIRRSLALTRGNFWRLLGLAVLLGIAFLVLLAAASAVGAIIGRLISPELEPFSVGALIVGLFAGIAQGAFAILSSVMLARIYVQLAGEGGTEAEASVPSSGS